MDLSSLEIGKWHPLDRAHLFLALAIPKKASLADRLWVEIKNNGRETVSLVYKKKPFDVPPGRQARITMMAHASDKSFSLSIREGDAEATLNLREKQTEKSTRPERPDPTGDGAAARMRSRQRPASPPSQGPEPDTEPTTDTKEIRTRFGRQERLIEQQQEAIASLMEKVAELERSEQARSGEMKDYFREKEHRLLEEEYEQLVEEDKKLRRDIARIEVDIRALEEKVAHSDDSEASFDALRRESIALQKIVEETHQRSRRLERAQTELRKTMGRNLDDFEDATHRLHILEGLYQGLKGATGKGYRKIFHRVTSNTTRVDQLDDEAAAQGKQLHHLSDRLIPLESQLAHLREALAQKDPFIDKMEGRLAELEILVPRVDQRVEGLEIEADRRVTDIIGEVTALTQTTRALEQRLTQTAEAGRSHTDELEVLKQSISRIGEIDQERDRALEWNKAGLARAMGTLEEQGATLQQLIEEDRARVHSREALRCELRSHDTRMEHIERDLAGTRVWIDHHLIRFQRLESKHDRLIDEVGLHGDRLAMLEEGFSEHESQLYLGTVHREQLERTIDERHQMLRDNLESLEKMRDEALPEVNQMLEAMTARVDDGLAACDEKTRRSLEPLDRVVARLSELDGKVIPKLEKKLEQIGKAQDDLDEALFPAEPEAWEQDIFGFGKDADVVPAPAPAGTAGPKHSLIEPELDRLREDLDALKTLVAFYLDRLEAWPDDAVVPREDRTLYTRADQLTARIDGALTGLVHLVTETLDRENLSRDRAFDELDSLVRKDLQPRLYRTEIVLQQVCADIDLLQQHSTTLMVAADCWHAARIVLVQEIDHLRATIHETRIDTVTLSSRLDLMPEDLDAVLGSQHETLARLEEARRLGDIHRNMLEAGFRGLADRQTALARESDLGVARIHEEIRERRHRTAALNIRQDALEQSIGQLSEDNDRAKGAISDTVEALDREIVARKHDTAALRIRQDDQDQSLGQIVDRQESLAGDIDTQRRDLAHEIKGRHHDTASLRPILSELQHKLQQLRGDLDRVGEDLNVESIDRNHKGARQRLAHDALAQRVDSLDSHQARLRDAVGSITTTFDDLCTIVGHDKASRLIGHDHLEQRLNRVAEELADLLRMSSEWDSRAEIIAGPDTERPTEPAALGEMKTKLTNLESTIEELKGHFAEWGRDQEERVGCLERWQQSHRDHHEKLDARVNKHHRLLRQIIDTLEKRGLRLAGLGERLDRVDTLLEEQKNRLTRAERDLETTKGELVGVHNLLEGHAKLLSSLDESAPPIDPELARLSAESLEETRRLARISEEHRRLIETLQQKLVDDPQTTPAPVSADVTDLRGRLKQLVEELAQLKRDVPSKTELIQNTEALEDRVEKVIETAMTLESRTEQRLQGFQDVVDDLSTTIQRVTAIDRALKGQAPDGTESGRIEDTLIDVTLDDDQIAAYVDRLGTLFEGAARILENEGGKPQGKAQQSASFQSLAELAERYTDFLEKNPEVAQLRGSRTIDQRLSEILERAGGRQTLALPELPSLDELRRRQVENLAKLASVDNPPKTLKTYFGRVRDAYWQALLEFRDKITGKDGTESETRDSQIPEHEISDIVILFLDVYAPNRVKPPWTPIAQKFFDDYLPDILACVDLELLKVVPGETIADARIHDIRGTKAGPYKPGVVVEVLTPGLRRMSDRRVVQKPVVIRGEPL